MPSPSNTDFVPQAIFKTAHKLRVRFAMLAWLLCGMHCAQAQADVPFMPFKITLAKAQAISYEGDPINFNVTVENTDATRRLPILEPRDQAGYNKIFYFKIYDAAQNRWQMRWVESREVTLAQQIPHLPTLRYLNPGEKVVFSANLNDYPRFYTKVESHHSLATPMFAGRNKVFLIYDPTGNPLGDTLYNYYDFPLASKLVTTPGKLDFPIYGTASEPYFLEVRKTDKAVFTFQSVVYACKRRPFTDVWEYSRDGQLIRLIEVKMDAANPRSEVEIDGATRQILRSFTWFSDHNIKAFLDRGMPPCNAIRLDFKMQDATRMAYSYAYDAHGTYTFSNYDADGLLEYTYLYKVGSPDVIHTRYKVKKSGAKPLKTQTWHLPLPFDPCGFPPSSWVDPFQHSLDSLDAC
jgi:hypothetical protein